MADPTYQVHDWEPGIADSGLFWTIPMSPGSIKADPSTGRLFIDPNQQTGPNRLSAAFQQYTTFQRPRRYEAGIRFEF